MEKKVFSVTLLTLLFLTFGLISFLVLLTNRHPYLVKQKLKIGALILSLSGAATGCTNTVACYSPIPDNIFEIKQMDSQTGHIVIDRSVSDTISGTIQQRQGDSFSYAIIDSSQSVIKLESISPVDGCFDENDEEFVFKLGNDFLPGNYELRFYTVPKDSINNIDWFSQFYSLTIL